MLHHESLLDFQSQPAPVLVSFVRVTRLFVVSFDAWIESCFICYIVVVLLSLSSRGGLTHTNTLIFEAMIATLSPEERAPVLGHLNRWAVS